MRPPFDSTRCPAALLLGLAFAAAAWAEIKLPASGVLAGPLDDAQSLMGDEITNYPFGKGVGSVPVHGWISVEFAPPANRAARFQLKWRAIGDVPFFAFASGHYLTVRGEQNFSSAVAVSGGELDLVTGEIRNFELHAVLENILIQKSSRYNRLPILSRGDGFSALFVDYPPTEYPFTIPYPDRPGKVFQEFKFVLDANQQIRGFEFRGTSFIPITLFPKLGLMPPYAFARNGATIIPGVDGCLPGTTPESQCISEARYPDGILSPDNAFLGPSLYLVTSELREVPRTRTAPAAHPGTGMSGAASAATGGRLYAIGGFDGRQVLARATAYDPARNEWTAMPDAPRAAFQACAAAAGGRVYLIGGRDRPDGAPVATVNVLDPAARTWTNGPALPAAVSAPACAELDGRVYVFGGLTRLAGGATAVSDGAWVLDSGSWRQLARMSSPKAGAAVGIARGELLVIGGTADGKEATRDVLIYSPAAAAWRPGPPVVRPVYGATAGSFENRVYVAGGRTSVDGTLDTGTVLYQGQTMQVLSGDKWYSGLYPPLAVADAMSGVIGDTWYLVGGDASSPARSAPPIGVLQAYQASSGWTVSSTFPVFTAATVRSAASLGVGPAQLAPGMRASIFGYNLSARTLSVPAARYTGRSFTTDLPDTLGDVRVTVGGTAAGILSVSPERIDFQVPFGVTPGRVSVEVARGTASAPAVDVQVAESAPGIFTYDYGETLALDVLDEAAAIANNASGKLNYPSQPARRGEAITLVCTGLGDVEPRPEPLQRAGRERVPAVVRRPEVLIDGKVAVVEAARLIPGEAGLYEVRARVPGDARTGLRVPVQLRSGQILSNRTVVVIE
jgi:uncharacterized protein (TIGR03437 family)